MADAYRVKVQGDHYKVTVEKGDIPTVRVKTEVTQGPSGLSAYQLAVKNGFVGTEEEWLESLKSDGFSVDPADAGMVLTNDGTDSYWDTLDNVLTVQDVTLDLGEL